MARTLSLSLTPAGSAATILLAIGLSLAAEVLADWLIGQPAPIPPPTINVQECIWVCDWQVARYSTTECVCRDLKP